MILINLQTVSATIAAAAVFGLALQHLVNGIKWRRDVALAYIAGLLVVSWQCMQWFQCETIHAVTLSAIIHASTLVIVAGYRLSIFHPLASFPGPPLFKLTNMRLALLVATGYRYLAMESLHKKYGAIIRIGPNKLSIASHTVLHSLYKSSRCFDKSEAYDLGDTSGEGLFFIREREAHTQRRAIWAPAFTAAMIEKHQPVLSDTIAELVDCITDRLDGRGAVDLSACLQHWSFDFMGHLVFGPCNTFDMMKNGDKKNLVRSGQAAMVTLEVLGEVPWLFKILWYLPMTKYIHALHEFAANMAETRKDWGVPDVPDICSYLLAQHDTDKSERLSDEELAVDSLFAIQAGSDTTSGILIFIFFYLLSDHSKYKKLQQELDDVAAQTDGTLDIASLHRLPFLNAVVKEALRLGTPFGGLARVIPDGGIMLNDVFVPGGTVVSVPVYTQHVSEANFWPKPKAFLPERWLPGGLGPNTRHEESAFIPFSFGPFGCLGKNLAIRELLVVTAQLVVTFDMSLAPGFDKDKFQRTIRNMKATLFPEPLEVVLTRRKAAHE